MDLTINRNDDSEKVNKGDPHNGSGGTSYFDDNTRGFLTNNGRKDKHHIS